MFENLRLSVDDDIPRDATFELNAEKVLNELKGLTAGKSGGSEGVSSDHILNGPLDTISQILAPLISALIRHGRRLESSDNWRQIALSSIFGKVIDRVVLSQENTPN